MADYFRQRSFVRQTPRLATLFVVGLVVLIFVSSLLLFTDMVSTRKSLGLLQHSESVAPDLVMKLKRSYTRERTLVLVLMVVTGSIGVVLILFYRYAVRVSTALREIQTIDRDILNSISRGIITVNLQGEVTSCNRAAEQIVEIQGEQTIGRSLEETFGSEDPLHLLLKESIQERSGAQDRDLSYTAKTGTVKPLRVTTFALKNEMAERVGGILLIKDMTEIRKMEERIQRSSRLAALGQFTQRLVHEIRNPLSAMDINLQLLEERLGESSEDSEIGRYLEIISTETRRLNDVLRNVQAFSNPERPDLETVDLHQIIHQVLFLIKEEAIRKDIEIVDHLQAEKSLVQADRDQMKQVFLNLLKNSIEAMSAGGTLEVLSRNDSEGKIIGMELVDSGSGIPMASLQRVFDPYYTTKKKGTGLGLSIVHTIITQHGGTIDVSSWLGEGTICSIILPLAFVGEAEDGNREAQNSHSGR
jgi:PAS domain S-box-containing protein